MHGFYSGTWLGPSWSLWLPVRFGCLSYEPSTDWQFFPPRSCAIMRVFFFFFFFLAGLCHHSCKLLHAEGGRPVIVFASSLASRGEATGSGYPACETSRGRLQLDSDAFPGVVCGRGALGGRYLQWVGW